MCDTPALLVVLLAPLAGCASHARPKPAVIEEAQINTLLPQATAITAPPPMVVQ